MGAEAYIYLGIALIAMSVIFGIVGELLLYIFEKRRSEE